MKGP
ncbi:outer membrane autotransporter barrel domain protein, partial [Yersinia pestis PY-63]|jgi:hypothetical protein